ncbi:hypothetical protein [Actinoallomurus sp. NPDC052274]|uniref:hypothetical protein n=1 Tax=Actinoallomurus sp. NPDC052274 TaxID=3155420 RepID=UPI00344AAA02
MADEHVLQDAPHREVVRVGLVDAVIDVQREGIEQVRRLAERGCEPQAGWVADGLLDELTDRLDWSRAHRHLFE